MRQPIADNKELALAQKLNERLDLVRPLLGRWNRVSGVRSQPDSQLAVDDEYKAWRHLSHAVNNGINLALDKTRAFRYLVRRGSDLVLPQFAHYPLPRAALEGG